MDEPQTEGRDVWQDRIETALERRLDELSQQVHARLSTLQFTQNLWGATLLAALALTVAVVLMAG